MILVPAGSNILFEWAAASNRPTVVILVWSGLPQIGYRNKAREEASRGGSLAHRPDIDLATEVSKLTSQVHLKQMKSGTPKAEFLLVSCRSRCGFFSYKV